MIQGDEEKKEEKWKERKEITVRMWRERAIEPKDGGKREEVLVKKKKGKEREKTRDEEVEVEVEEVVESCGAEMGSSLRRRRY